MWDVICEDIVLEILIRLPNCKKAIELSTVCKRWLAVIRSPDFRKRFNEEKNKNKNNKCFKFTHMLGSSPWPPQNFDFIPWEHPKVLACGGGLLVLYVSNTNQNNYNLCVCNPMTREWSLLPRIPTLNYYNWLGIACSTPDNSSFKLVNVRSIREDGMTIPDDRIKIDIFCSESKSWSEASLALASSFAKNISRLSSGVQSGTRLYWMNGNNSNCTGILALDPFLGLAELVKLPAGCQGKLKTMKLSSVLGRLCLSQLYWKKRVEGYSFKIWELSDSDGGWRLVRRAWPALKKYYASQVVGLHPNDGDKVFLKCHGERDLRLYDIASGAITILGRFPYSYCVGNYTVVHPCAFPCPIPNFGGETRKRKNTQPAPSCREKRCIS